MGQGGATELELQTKEADFKRVAEAECKRTGRDDRSAGRVEERGQGGWENHFLIRKGRRVKLQRRPDWKVAAQDLWSVCGVKLMTADRCDEIRSCTMDRHRAGWIAKFCAN